MRKMELGRDSKLRRNEITLNKTSFLVLLALFALFAHGCGLWQSGEQASAEATETPAEPTASYIDSTSEPKPAETESLVPSATLTSEMRATDERFYGGESTGAVGQLRDTVSRPYWPNIFSNDFTEDWSWEHTFACGYVRVAYTGGMNHWQMTASDCDRHKFASMNTPRLSYGTVAAGLWGEQESGEAASYGIIFRADVDEQNVLHSGYVFVLDEREGARLFLFRGDNEYQPLSDIVGEEFVEEGGPNYLAVITEGSNISGYLNDHLVLEVEDTRLEAGEMGIFTLVEGPNTSAQFLFHDFVGLVPADEAVGIPGRSVGCEEGCLPEGWQWIVAQDFKDASNPNGWPTDDYRDDYVSATYQFTNGTYVWNLVASENATQGVLHRRFNALGEFSDFIAVVNIRSQDGPHRSSAGIVFRENPGGYYFYTVGNDGLARLLLFTNTSGWQLLAERQFPGIDSATIRTLGVHAEGSNIACSLGTEIAFTVVNTTFARGRIGLAVDLVNANDQAEVVFDEFGLAVPD